MPVFEGYHMVETRPTWPLAAGLPTFGVGYLAAFVIGFAAGDISDDQDAWAPMFIPAVGPFIAIDTAKDTIEFDGERIAMVSTGVFQILGIAITALRWVLPPKKQLVLDPWLRVRPVSSGGVPGLAATF